MSSRSASWGLKSSRVLCLRDYSSSYRWKRRSVENRRSSANAKRRLVLPAARNGRSRKFVRRSNRQGWTKRRKRHLERSCSPSAKRKGRITKPPSPNMKRKSLQQKQRRKKKPARRRRKRPLRRSTSRKSARKSSLNSRPHSASQRRRERHKKPSAKNLHGR